MRFPPFLPKDEQRRMSDEGKSDEAAPRPARHRWLLRFEALALVALAAFVTLTSIRIVHEGRMQELHAADAIVVFGAAEYAGHPSPGLRARLDHAYELFQRGLAPVVITTGGSAQEPDFSEGGVGRDYLLRRGIPEQALIAETQGSDTAQSATRVANIMRANGMRTCIAVSDVYHVFRIRALLEHEGVQVEVAPRPESRPRRVWDRFAAVMREAISYLAWKAGLP